MILFENTTFDAASIGQNLGMPEYSYWFVRKAFAHVLARFGEVRAITDPETELNAAVAAVRARGDDALFFSFNPPHYVPLGLDCPTIPVFAWEYDTIPDESWTANPQYDWRVTLAATGRAIVHCTSSAAAVRRAMGEDFPVWAIPAPVFDGNAARAGTARGWQEPTGLTLDGGVVIDAGTIDLSLFTHDRVDEHGARALRLLRRAFADASWRPQTLRIEGVVYTAVFNTADGRKNWHDLLGGFVWAFRDTPDATLILKITHADMFEGIVPVLRHLSKLGRFACRVLVIHGLLSDDAYGRMVDVTSYAVNTAHGEGQCLPLMEFMSAGRPAIAPDHSAMTDYMSAENGFVVASDQCITNWPHDHREARRCMSNWARFPDVVRAYRDSYRVAKADPARYSAMSAAAVAALRDFCSDHVVWTKLVDVLDHVRARALPEPLAARDVGVRDLLLNGWSNAETGELTPGFPIGADDVVVDVGCGDGGIVRFCAERGAHIILADVDPARVAEASARLDGAAARQVDAHVTTEGEPLPIADGTASRVICNQVLEHVDDPERLMAELVRIGRPGALYLLAVPGAAHEHVQQQVAPPQCFEKPNHIRIFEADEFDALIERAGLVIERRSNEGFFWSLWFAFFWQTGAGFGGSDVTLDAWTSIWSGVLDGTQGGEIMAALDEVMPKRRVVIARKPEPAAPTRTGLLARLFAGGRA